MPSPTSFPKTPRSRDTRNSSWAANLDSGFVEIDLVGHEGGNASGGVLFHLDRRRYRDRVDSEPLGAQQGGAVGVRGSRARHRRVPVPDHRYRLRQRHRVHRRPPAAYCEKEEIARSRPVNSNDGAHGELKNWTRVCVLLGYYRYDTPASWTSSTRSGRWTPKSPTISCPAEAGVKQRHGARVTNATTRPPLPISGRSWAIGTTVSGSSRAAVFDREDPDTVVPIAHDRPLMGSRDHRIWILPRGCVRQGSRRDR